ncbi:hypothetical protein AGMMS49975_25640 [Clostridia bacterium]|nr:hypothetical protein AGMMS49975_25640 [Clostridia bacterium]
MLEFLKEYYRNKYRTAWLRAMFNTACFCCFLTIAVAAGNWETIGELVLCLAIAVGMPVAVMVFALVVDAGLTLLFFLSGLGLKLHRCVVKKILHRPLKRTALVAVVFRARGFYCTYIWETLDFLFGGEVSERG